MPHLRERRDRPFGHALRWAVGRDVLWMRRFQLLQPLDEPVVLQVRDFRRGLDVILLVVPADLLAELFDFVLRVG